MAPEGTLSDHRYALLPQGAPSDIVACLPPQQQPQAAHLHAQGQPRLLSPSVCRLDVPLQALPRQRTILAGT